jgi:hypothetical protein
MPQKREKECLNKEKPGQYESKDCKPDARFLGTQQVNLVEDRIPDLSHVWCEWKTRPRASKGEISALNRYWGFVCNVEARISGSKPACGKGQECQFSGDGAFNIVLYSGLIRLGKHSTPQKRGVPNRTPSEGNCSETSADPEVTVPL